MNKALGAVLGFSLLAWFLFAPQNPVGLHNDDAQYFLSARGILEEGAYLDMSLPEQPRQTHFPAGYPILLSVPATAGGAPAAKFLSLIFILGSLILLRRFFAPSIPALPLALMTALIASNPGTLYYSTVVMSEAAFLFFTVLALTVADESFKPLFLKNHARRRDVLVGLLALASCLIRPFGVFLAAALAVDFWLRGKRNEAGQLIALVGGGIIANSTWSASGSGIETLTYTQEIGNYFSAFNGIGEFLKTWISQVGGYATLWGTAFATPAGLMPWSLPAPLAWILGAAATAATIAGWVAIRRTERLRPVALYIMFYVFALLFWRTRAARYLFPVAPFLIFYLVVFLKRFPTGALYGLLALNLASVGAWAARGSLPSFMPPAIEVESLAWINENAPNNALIASEKSATTRLHANRYAYPLLHSASPDAIFSYLLNRGVSHVVLKPNQPLLHAAKGSPSEIQEKAHRIATHRVLMRSPFLERVHGKPQDKTIVLRFKKPVGAYAEAEAAFKSGMAALEKKDFSNAVTHLETALALDERLFHARYTLGFIYMQSGKEKKGIKTNLTLGRQWPGVPMAHLTAARGLGLIGRMGPAKGALQLAIKLAEPTATGIEQDQKVLQDSKELYLKIFGPDL